MILIPLGRLPSLLRLDSFILDDTDCITEAQSCGESLSSEIMDHFSDIIELMVN